MSPTKYVFMPNYPADIHESDFSQLLFIYMHMMDILIAHNFIVNILVIENSIIEA